MMEAPMEPIIPDWLMQVLRRAGYCVEHALLFVKSEADEAELFEEISNKFTIAENLLKSRTSRDNQTNWEDLIEMVEELRQQGEKFQLGKGWRNKILELKIFYKYKYDMANDLKRYSDSITRQVQMRYPHVNLAEPLHTFLEDGRIKALCHICKAGFTVDRARNEERGLDGKMIYDHYALAIVKNRHNIKYI